MPKSPSTNGSNGHRNRGQFPAGNPGGPGNPHAKRVAELRSLLLGQITDRDLREIVAMLIRRAKKGDLVAVRELLDRTLGKAKQAVEVEMAPQAADADADATPEDHRENMVYFMEVYASYVVPKRAWLPGVRRWYEAWRSDPDRKGRPADFDALVEMVEARCNWMRLTPEAAVWPNDASVYDGKEIKIDSARLPHALSEQTRGPRFSARYDRKLWTVNRQ